MADEAEKIQVDGEIEQPSASDQGPGASGTALDRTSPAAGEDENDEDDDDDEQAKAVEAFVKSLPEPVQECVKALSALDTEVSALEAAFRKEMRELERKYDRLGAPMFEKRAAIVNGTEKLEKADGTGVPGFWLGAMQNCNIIAETITETDEVVLQSLTDITAKTLPEETGIGFQLSFHFKENEFFKNSVLTKTYFEADDGASDEAETAEGTEIEWMPGKNVTVRTVKKHQRSKKGKGTRTVTKTEPCPSFFNFFSPPKIPGPDEEPLEEEEEDQREMELQADYDMGLAFHERLVPHAIKWFTGEAEDDDEEDDDDIEDDDDDDDNDDDDARVMFGGSPVPDDDPITIAADPTFGKRVDQAFRRLKAQGPGAVEFERKYCFSDDRTDERQEQLALGGDPTLSVCAIARTHPDAVEALGFARVVLADEEGYGAGQVDSPWKKLHFSPSEASWAKFRAVMRYFADFGELSQAMKAPETYAGEIGIKEPPEAVYVRTAWGNGCKMTCLLCTANHVYSLDYTNG